MNRLAYPNPQLIRQNWLDLNGEWDFTFGTDAVNTSATLQQLEFDQKITVPYSYTFPAAGVEADKYHPVVWYRRTFQLHPQSDKSYLLHFEAVDYIAEVWINQHYAGKHIGGHTPFMLDITPYVAQNNEIIVKVIDHTETTQPLGKQTWKDHNFGCWYTRTIGIWQNVWLEETGKTYLTDLQMIPSAHQAQLAVEIEINQDIAAEITYQVTFKGAAITHGSCAINARRAKFNVQLRNFDPVPEIHLWNPATPDLYDIEFQVRTAPTTEALAALENSANNALSEVSDAISSYFGLRDIAADRGTIFLNDQKYYLKLLLNQGYYPKGGLTGTPQEFRADIEKMQAMGFNGHRIHQKIENNRLLYLCDALGFFIWAEFPSPYEFTTSLMDNVLSELPAFIRKHINHPSVIVYVMMNESWGVFDIAHNPQQQNFVNALYYQAKAYDPSRLVIGNDGYEQTRTDIITIHDYNVDAQNFAATYHGQKENVLHGAPSPMSGRRIFCSGYERSDLPIMITEYGGIAYTPNVEKDDDSWGYGERLTDAAQVLQRITDLTKAVAQIEYCSGFCYTQTSDVEQEVNGLLDHQHEYKFDPAKIRAVLDESNNYGYVKF